MQTQGHTHLGNTKIKNKNPLAVKQISWIPEPLHLKNNILHLRLSESRASVTQNFLFSLMICLSESWFCSTKIAGLQNLQSALDTFFFKTNSIQYVITTICDISFSHGFCQYLNLNKRYYITHFVTYSTLFNVY